MQSKNNLLIMSKQADSDYSSGGSSDSSPKSCKNNEGEDESYSSSIIININNLDKCNNKSNCCDKKCEEHENFKCSNKLCINVLKLPYEFFYRQNDDGDTHLHITIILGFYEATYWLINLAPHPCLLDIINDDGLTALHLAVIACDARIVRRLVLSGANKLLRTRVTGNTPLHLASAQNCIYCIKALTDPLTDEERYYCSPGFRQKIMVNNYLQLKNYNGETCLHIAASQGHFELTRHLLHLGADVFVRDGLRGMTALHLALEKNHTNVAWLLANEQPLCIDMSTYDGSSTYEIAKKLDPRLAYELVRLRYNYRSKVDEIDIEKKLSTFSRMSICLRT